MNYPIDPKKTHSIHIDRSALFALRDFYDDDVELFHYELGKRFYGLNCLMMGTADDGCCDPQVKEESDGSRSAWLNLDKRAQRN